MWDSLLSPPCRAISNCWAHAMTSLRMHTWSMMVAWTIIDLCYQEMEECENCVSGKMVGFHITASHSGRNSDILNVAHELCALVCVWHSCNIVHRWHNWLECGFQDAEHLFTPVFCHSFSFNSRSTAANSLPTAFNKSLHRCVCVVWMAERYIQSLWR